MSDEALIDLLVIGGGINGAGIARDAAGRGLRVQLLEQHDLASHTSAASTKLIHGGLRYLEHYEFRLVREALMERERLLAIAPHIIWPLTFVLPHNADQRPAWMIRAGLFLYDHLAPRKTLPASRAIDFAHHPAGAALQPGYRRGFTYADCWVEDSRLVMLNAMDAAARGARIATRHKLVGARPDGHHWLATIEDQQALTRSTLRARAIVNAAGPWVGSVLAGALGRNTTKSVRLIKGSHIITRRLFAGDFAFIMQNPDQRVVFAIPYEQRFTLIGTTDIPFTGDPGDVSITDEETDYLCQSVNRYLRTPISRADIRHTYAGVRPLYDDHAASASTVTRDYVLDVEGDRDTPVLLSVFGGKITTYRKLAEHALDKLAHALDQPLAPAWTAMKPLPGGDISAESFEEFATGFAAAHPFLPAAMAHRLARAYGTRASALLDGATAMADLGENFGGLTVAEIRYLRTAEFAITADDILWRRSKLGLHLDVATRHRVEQWLGQHPIE